MKTSKYNDEVIYSIESVTKVNAAYIKELKSMAENNPRKRMRLCCHNEIDNVLHEMLIVHTRGAYIPPHKHTNKTESFHIIEGELQIIIFNEGGDVVEVIDMGEHSTGKNFYYRLTENYFHTVIPLTDYVVFHETTNGPFIRKETIFASWAPDENNIDEQTVYLQSLEKKIKDDF